VIRIGGEVRVPQKIGRYRAVLLTTLALAAVVSAQSRPVEIDAGLHAPFRFVAYGDTRFTDPANTTVTNPQVRQQLVRAIAETHPAFILFSGDITYNGDSAEDWKVYDQETAVWREGKVPVYPTLGNRDLHGDVGVALENYFARFPNLKQNRFYSVRAGNSLILALDSALGELDGKQGEWLQSQFQHLPPGTDFVFIVLHHPPYSSSTGDKSEGHGGHGARLSEQNLAAYLEEKQKTLRPRIVVIAGHVHNYERHAHGGVLYFVTGGGGAHAYPINRSPGDLFQSQAINYHYLLLEVDAGKLKATMNRLELNDGVTKWTQPDSVTISFSLSTHPAE
jgi:hypothetical protein